MKYISFPETFKDILVVFWLFVTLAFVEGCHFGCRLLVETFFPFVSLDLGFERGFNLYRKISTYFFSNFYLSISLNQGWFRIYYTSVFAPNLFFGFLFRIFVIKSWASELILTFSENFNSPSWMSLNMMDWDLL